MLGQFEVSQSRCLALAVSFRLLFCAVSVRREIVSMKLDRLRGNARMAVCMARMAGGVPVACMREELGMALALA